jgi:hypothetical protein
VGGRRASDPHADVWISSTCVQYVSTSCRTSAPLPASGRGPSNARLQRWRCIHDSRNRTCICWRNTGVAGSRKRPRALASSTGLGLTAAAGGCTGLLGDSIASGERCLVGVRRSGERLHGLALAPSSSDHILDSSSDHSGRYTARVAALSIASVPASAQRVAMVVALTVLILHAAT